MKKYRILPGAAGIIALTATLGFVDRRHEIEIDNKAAGGAKKRKMTEVVWMNY